MNNSRSNAFYVPEVELVIKHYQELEPDPVSQERFVLQQQAIATRIMKVSACRGFCVSLHDRMQNAIILYKWKYACKLQKKDDDGDHSRSRQARYLFLGLTPLSASFYLVLKANYWNWAGI
jgi:hypothetical protein